MPKKRFCGELNSHRISGLSVCAADGTSIYRHGDMHTHTCTESKACSGGFGSCFSVSIELLPPSPPVCL